MGTQGARESCDLKEAFERRNQGMDGLSWASAHAHTHVRAQIETDTQRETEAGRQRDSG